MDEQPDVPADDAGARRPRVQFGPDLRLSGLFLAAGLLCAAAAMATDAAGRLLLLAAALLLAGTACCDLIYRPRLRADAEGVTIRAPLQRTQLRWEQIARVHADVHTRHGLRSVSLEIDTGENLYVLSRRTLGAEPEQVADLVNAFAPKR